MKDRAYARVDYSRQHLGLRLVNPQQQTFFVYAKYLLRMLAAPKELVLVKKRDRQPEKATYYHGGEVIGCLRKRVRGGTKIFLLTLYFSPLEQRMRYDVETGQLHNVLEIQEYRFPREEFSQIAACLELMVNQKDQFDQLIQESRELPGSEILFNHTPQGESLAVG